MKQIAARILSPIFLLVVLSLMSLNLATLNCAYGESLSDKQSQADNLSARINEAQNQINAANDLLDVATAKHNEILAEMNEQRTIIDSQSARVSEVQKRLSNRAKEIYKGVGVVDYLCVLLGANSFSEFVNTYSALERIAANDAALIQEAKDVRAQAQDAYTKYSVLEQEASAELAAATEAQETLLSAQEKMQSELDQITSEIAAEEAEIHSTGDGGEQEAQEAAASTSAGGAGYFCNPCPSAWESSGWGYRTYDNSFHKGTDYATSWGSPVYAAESGTVIYCVCNDGWNGGAGNWIWISHGNGLATKYMHLSSIAVYQGQYVSRGDYIGAVGSTGDSSGPHLHFQVEVNGTAVCPYDYL